MLCIVQEYRSYYSDWITVFKGVPVNEEVIIGIDTPISIDFRVEETLLDVEIDDTLHNNIESAIPIKGTITGYDGRRAHLYMAEITMDELEKVKAIIASYKCPDHFSESIKKISEAPDVYQYMERFNAALARAQHEQEPERSRHRDEIWEEIHKYKQRMLLIAQSTGEKQLIWSELALSGDYRQEYILPDGTTEKSTGQVI